MELYFINFVSTPKIPHFQKFFKTLVLTKKLIFYWTPHFTFLFVIYHPLPPPPPNNWRESDIDECTRPDSILRWGTDSEEDLHAV